jgi:hypothetical protein
MYSALYVLRCKGRAVDEPAQALIPCDESFPHSTRAVEGAPSGLSAAFGKLCRL